MLLVGNQVVYASHLPMFHRPHDYQVVLELELSAPAQAVYEASRRDFPREAVYTLEPEKFVLPELVAHPRAFRADVYRGHFERGGTRIANGAVVQVRRVVYFRQLQPTEADPARPEFLVFGNAQEQFMAHRIAGRPDYDQVMRVAVPPATLPLLRQRFLPWQADTVLLAPLAKPGLLRGTALGKPLTVRVVQSIYTETDDLR